MTLLALITVLIAMHSATSCDLLDDNILEFSPFKVSYEENDEVAMTCLDKYVISWASSEDDDSAGVKCVSSDWAPNPVVDTFSGTVGCVECVAGTVDCTDGTCTDGECVCKEGYQKSGDSPRLCELIQCAELSLSNQIADTAGPYDVNAQVKVTCKDGFHVEGEDNVVEQTLTCGSEGNFDESPKGCIACASDADCTDGTCNAHGACECDEGQGYKLKDGDASVCEKVVCEDDSCSNNGVCSVKGIELECECKTGTEGDTCAEFSSNPCDDNPCQNEGTCSRDMSDPEDYTKHTCSCAEGFEGDNCEDATEGETPENDDEQEDGEEDEEEDEEEDGEEDENEDEKEDEKEDENEDEKEVENEDEKEDEKEDDEDNTAGRTFLGNIIGILVVGRMIFF